MGTSLPTPGTGRDAAETWVADHLTDLVDDPDRIFGSDRGASGLSPYIRHGLLTLRQVWRHVAGGPGRDVAKFRDELMWQEYARHWYLHNGAATARGVRREQARVDADADWDRSMACVDATLTELESSGWLVNQTRMWLSSEWAVRRDDPGRQGRDWWFRNNLRSLNNLD